MASQIISALCCNPFDESGHTNVALGGLVVSVLATGPKVRGFKRGRGRWILRVMKSAASLPSEGSRSHVVDLRHVKEPYKHEKMLAGKIQRPCFSPVFHLLRY
jgi:hypothetical protein